MLLQYARSWRAPSSKESRTKYARWYPSCRLRAALSVRALHTVYKLRDTFGLQWARS
jgi:hypothetical protein